jgi:uncharacterized protein YegL
MTDKNKTHITFVIDRSGSMASVKDDAQGGFNELVEEQKKLTGECSLSIIEFDDKYNVFYNGDLKNFGQYTLIPRGGTALFDSVGKAIVETGQYLSSLPENERPALVIFCVVTDGQENSSREYSKKQIKEMIKHQTDSYQWQFTFLCSDMNTFMQAQDLEIDSVAAFDVSQFKGTYAATSGKFGAMRSATMAGASVDNAYNAKQLSMMKDAK